MMLAWLRRCLNLGLRRPRDSLRRARYCLCWARDRLGRAGDGGSCSKISKIIVGSIGYQIDDMSSG